MATLQDPEREHFARHGYVSVGAAFAADAAARMRDAVWDVLAERDIHRHDPTTWTIEAPDHLQALKQVHAFAEIATPRTLGAIDDLLGPGLWARPRDWGAFFVLFPRDRPWSVPTAGW